MLQVGDAFPEFELPDQDGKIRSKAGFLGTPTLVYFYPKDDTPGCTKQACGLRDDLSRFGDVKVVGVSGDTVESHRKFADKYDLSFPLLADVDRKLSMACGAWGEKSLYGKLVVGMIRMSFLLDQDGVITKVWRRARAATHSADVLSILKQ